MQVFENNSLSLETYLRIFTQESQLTNTLLNDYIKFYQVISNKEILKQIFRTDTLKNKRQASEDI